MGYLFLDDNWLEVLRESGLITVSKSVYPLLAVHDAERGSCHTVVVGVGV